MKSLKEYICEGLLDRVKNKEVNHKVFVEEFLEANYKTRSSYTIKETKSGFVVDVKGDMEVKNKDITSLTNEFFEFGEVSGWFDCADCESLKTLEGAPKKVGRDFDCSNCDSLKTLEGAPRKVGRDFACSYCKSLKTLEGAPKEVGGDFICFNCKSLKTLEGAPQKVGGKFDCYNCGIEFTEDDVKKYTTVLKHIYV